jgi:hypothetical protein
MSISEQIKSFLLTKKRQLLLAILVISLLVSIFGTLIFPSWRTGFLGIGLPAPMKTFTGRYVNFSIDYPQSWVAHETPHGIHGDQEVIAEILVPGRSWPSVVIAHQTVLEEDIYQIATWGDTRAKKHSNYVATTLEPLNAPNFDGLLREYSWESSSPVFGVSNVQCKDWYVLSTTSGYALSFCAEKKDWHQVDQVFQQMLMSFSTH